MRDSREYLVDGVIAFLRELSNDEYQRIILRARPPEPPNPDQRTIRVEVAQ